MDNITPIIAVVFVVIVVVFQMISFAKTARLIKALKNFFPNVDDMGLKDSSITKEILRDKSKLKEFLQKIPPRQSNDDDDTDIYTDVTLITLSSENVSNHFSLIVNRTNEYLCKNVGTSADFAILKGISEHQVEALEDEIHSSLNVPLYLGLAGTFIGIITGLLGVDFKSILNANGSMDGLQHLLNGVITAMFASLLGLSLTVWNSAVAYSKAVSVVDGKKEDYYDFIRRELMPVLSNSMTSSLNSLKDALGHFVDKFGRTLKDSADSLDIFKTYQDQLNGTIKSMTDATTKIDTLLSKFSEFGAGLSLVVNNQNKAATLQQEFKDAIETHFPTGSEGRDVWRKEFDTLMEDAKQVSESLSSQLTASTEYVKKFVSENDNFFNSFDKMKEVIAKLVQYTQVQAECYKDLKGEILNLRKDYKDAQIGNIDLNKAILDAVKKMTDAIKYKSNDKE